MRKPSMQIKCCHRYEKLPKRDYTCFIPEINAELNKLFTRHQRAFVKRKHILALAYPTKCTPRFTPKCPCRLDKPINIVRLEQPIYTRTEQLAYPQPRRLWLFKVQNRKKLSNQRMEIINRYLRKSLLSMYSRLQNIQPPKAKIPIPKWGDKERREHLKYLRKLAKPIKAPKQPRIPKEWMELKAMKRYKKLAKPKKRLELEKNEWILTPELKEYQPTPRVLALSKPKLRDEEALYQSLPIQVTENAKKYKASSRVKELATPHEKRAGESDIKENPFAIAPNALKAKPSKRTQELAEPKEYENVHERENPNAISPAALKAKATPRTIELAKPKGS